MKFDPVKMLQVIEQDPFLQISFHQIKGSGTKNALEVVFNTYVLGDAQMEKLYMDLCTRSVREVRKC